MWERNLTIDNVFSAIKEVGSISEYQEKYYRKLYDNPPGKAWFRKGYGKNLEYCVKKENWDVSLRRRGPGWRLKELKASNFSVYFEYYHDKTVELRYVAGKEFGTHTFSAQLKEAARWIGSKYDVSFVDTTEWLIAFIIYKARYQTRYRADERPAKSIDDLKKMIFNVTTAQDSLVKAFYKEDELASKTVEELIGD